MMHVERAELRVLRLPLVRFFETSFGRQHERELILVRLLGDGLSGWGECVAEADPYYSAETTTTAWYALRDYLVPRLLGRRFEHPAEVYAALSQVRGHQMAKAAVEMAAWDLHAHRLGLPLSKVLGGVRARIASGVSVGIQDSIEQLLEQVAKELAAGYQRIKIKVKPGWDVGPVEAIRARFGDVRLMVDANAAYTLDDAGHLAALDPFGLMMIEQPLDYDDLADHAELQRRLATAVCLDESIDSVAHGRAAVALGACRVVNIKPGRIGGIRETMRLHDLCAGHGIPVWHGGMLETGIGRAHNIHISTLPNFTLPGDVAASKRYFQPDLIEPGIEVEPDGTIEVPTGPGIGVTVIDERVAAATHAHLVLGS